MMVFFLSNMIENQLMSTGAFEITLNGERRCCLLNTRIHAKGSTSWLLLKCPSPNDVVHWRMRIRWLVSFCRRACVVQTGVGSPALHAAARADPGQRDEDERSHEHKSTPPLLTRLLASGRSRRPLGVRPVFRLLVVKSISSRIWRWFAPLILSSRFEAGLSLACEVMFMKVCAEDRKTVSAD